MEECGTIKEWSIIYFWKEEKFDAINVYDFLYRTINFLVHNDFNISFFLALMFQVNLFIVFEIEMPQRYKYIY